MCSAPQWLFGFDNFHAAHVGNKGLGQHEAAVLLLAVFKYGGHGATCGQAGTVERMQKHSLAALGLEADIRPAGVKIGAVGTGRNFVDVLLCG